MHLWDSGAVAVHDMEAWKTRLRMSVDGGGLEAMVRTCGQTPRRGAARPPPTLTTRPPPPTPGGAQRDHHCGPTIRGLEASKGGGAAPAAHASTARHMPHAGSRGGLHEPSPARAAELTRLPQAGKGHGVAIVGAWDARPALRIRSAGPCRGGEVRGAIRSAARADEHWPHRSGPPE